MEHQNICWMVCIAIVLFVIIYQFINLCTTSKSLKIQLLCQFQHCIRCNSANICLILCALINSLYIMRWGIIHNFEHYLHENSNLNGMKCYISIGPITTFNIALGEDQRWICSQLWVLTSQSYAHLIHHLYSRNNEHDFSHSMNHLWEWNQNNQN